MAPHHIFLQFDAAADRATVYRALSSTEGINGWWTNVADVPAPGGVMLLTFPEMPKPWQVEIVSSTRDRLEWLVQEFPPPWQGTRMLWTLTDSPEIDGTRINLEHRDWDSESPFVPTVTYRWGQVLHALKRFVESQKPDPYFVN